MQWSPPRLPVFGTTVVLLVTLGAVAAVAEFTPLLPSDGIFAPDMMSVFTALLGGSLCLWASHRLRRDGSSWRTWSAWAMFATMMFCYAGGDILWLVFTDADGTPPILSFADLLYLLGLLPAVVGLVIYPAARGWRDTWGPVLFDAALLAGAALLTIGVLDADEVIEKSDSARDAFMLLVYPVTDVLMVSLVVLVLMRSIGHGRLDVALLGVCFAIYSATDGGYAVMTVNGLDSTGTLVDLGYVLGPLCLAAAAVHAVTHRVGERQLQRHLVGLVPSLLPDLTALAALGLFVAQYRHLDSTTWLLAVGALTLTGLRQLALTVDRQRLRATLEDRISSRTAELAQLQREYDNLETLKYEFVSAVSHELRTPLTAIRGSLEMLADGDVGRLPPRAQPVMEMAVRGSERLARLVDDIIDLERLARGAFRFQHASERLAPLLADAAAPLQALARERGVHLVVTPTDEIVHCDADRVVQALVNLLGNALKFTPAGGAVTVGAIGGVDDVQVFVADEGRGIPEQHLEAIFDRFHQVERGDARDHGGAGLGLPITKHIVDGHGGRIWVESTLGQGTTFHFTLPRPTAYGLAVHPPVTQLEPVEPVTEPPAVAS